MIGELLGVLAGFGALLFEVGKASINRADIDSYNKKHNFNINRQYELDRKFYCKEGLVELEGLVGYPIFCSSSGRPTEDQEYIVRYIAEKEGWTYHGIDITRSPEYVYRSEKFTEADMELWTKIDRETRQAFHNYKLRRVKWRQWLRRNPDGLKYHVCPELYETEEEYRNAVQQAGYAWREKYKRLDTSEHPIRPSSFDTEEAYLAALNRGAKIEKERGILFRFRMDEVDIDWSSTDGSDVEKVLVLSAKYKTNPVSWLRKGLYEALRYKCNELDISILEVARAKFSKEYDALDAANQEKLLKLYNRYKFEGFCRKELFEVLEQKCNELGLDFEQIKEAAKPKRKPKSASVPQDIQDTITAYFSMKASGYNTDRVMTYLTINQPLVAQAISESANADEACKRYQELLSSTKMSN